MLSPQPLRKGAQNNRIPWRMSTLEEYIKYTIVLGVGQCWILSPTFLVMEFLLTLHWLLKSSFIFYSANGDSTEEEWLYCRFMIINIIDYEPEVSNFGVTQKSQAKYTHMPETWRTNCQKGGHFFFFIPLSIIQVNKNQVYIFEGK